MKILSMVETQRPLMAPYMLEAAKTLGNVEVVEGHWFGPKDEDYLNVMRRIEVNGPACVDVPDEYANFSDADVAIGSFTPFSAEGMDVLKSVKVIGIIRAGLENIDIKAATERGILVINAGGRNAHAVSDFAIGLLIAETRNIARLHHNFVSGYYFKGPRDQSNLHDLYGRTIGLVGFGYIGKLMAKKLSGFEMRILAYDPYASAEDAKEFNVELVDKDTLFSESDYISVHARLLPETHHMIGRHEIGLMKKTAFFINTARAGLVDTEALIEALQEKRIAGAGIDVFDEEPLPLDNPLYKLDNVTLTPHRAGVTIDATVHSPQMVIDRVSAVIDGIPTDGLVNPEVIQTPEFQKWIQASKAALGR